MFLVIEMELSSLFLLCLFLTLWLYPVDPSCTLPFNGTWVTSNRGTWSVSSSSIQNFKMTLDTAGSSLWTMDCYSSDSTFYILKSNGIYKPYTTVDTYLYICLSFTLQNNHKYLFSIHTPESEIRTSPSIYERLIVKHVSVTSVSQSEICTDISNLGMEQYHVAVKYGHEVSGAVTCPTSIQGTLSYTYTGMSCTYTSLDTCIDETIFKYNDTLCTDNPMFSSEGTLYCVFTGTSGSYTYITLYNADSSVTNPTNFHFSCMVYSSSGSIISASINPEECLRGQTPASLTSSYGKIVTFTTISTCSTSNPTSENDFTWLYILIGVLVFIFIILGIAYLIKFVLKRGQVAPRMNTDIIISKPPTRYIYK